jgi:hypothetical protein
MASQTEITTIKVPKRIFALLKISTVKAVVRMKKMQVNKDRLSISPLKLVDLGQMTPSERQIRPQSFTTDPEWFRT